MTVNLHDSAHELENAIRNSDEYTTLRKLYDEVNADASAKEMFEKFRNMQIELQQKQMSGQEIEQGEVAQAQILVADVQKNEKISKLMEAEQRMSTIVTELNQIVLKPLEELYGSMGQ
ncbi:YlbF family regulator [Bacillus sp. V3B]|uniref:YlbF family regulator n=1 Tax=Bacillus sp. V3B TaxID=2804915 RepID=UPI00210E959B|nr:YlbF family regulator [Bacillus sp. V3B]MCQ6273384.1 YlbF family regulator [Bacillus sp. V3B]